MPDLEEAFERAGEIAKKLPPALQETAFNRALDALLAAQQKPTRRGQSRRTATAGVTAAASDVEFSLVNEIDRTKYPDIGATSRVADRALKVLQLAREDHNVGELTAAQISQILVQKFRLPTSVAPSNG